MPATVAPSLIRPQSLPPDVPASPEFALLLAASSLHPTPEDSAQIAALVEHKLDWPKFIYLAEHHGVVPRVFQNLAGQAAALPPSAFQQLRAKFEGNTRQTLWLTNLLGKVLDTLQAHGIPALPYKGPVLAKILYDNVALRQFSDLDILIRPADVPRARLALAEAGFQPHLDLIPRVEQAYIASAYEYSFDGFGQKNVLEVQWRVLPRFYSIDFDVDSFFQTAITVRLDEREARTLYSDDLLLTLCAHAAKHLWERLSWIWDIADLAIAAPINWQEAIRRASVLGMSRILGISFFLAHRLLGSPIPASLEQLVSDGQVQRLGGQILNAVVASAECDTETTAYFRRIARLRERSSDKFRFFTRLAFTPGVSEWSVVRLPAPLFPLYGVIRLFRLAMKLLRLP